VQLLTLSQQHSFLTFFSIERPIQLFVLAFLIFIAMIIKKADDVGALSGSLGGQYFQTSSNTPSIRTKKSGGLLGRSTTPRQLAAIQFLGKAWTSLDDTEKLLWWNWGRRVTEFNQGTSSDIAFAYSCFCALNAPFLIWNKTYTLLPSLSWVARSSPVTISNVTLFPFTLTARRNTTSGGSQVAVYASLRFSPSQDGARPSWFFCRMLAGSASSLAIVQNDIRSRYGRDCTPISVQLRVLRIGLNTRFFTNDVSTRFIL
jgi:hypothetical protein